MLQNTLHKLQVMTVSFSYPAAQHATCKYIAIYSLECCSAPCSSVAFAVMSLLYCLAWSARTGWLARFACAFGCKTCHDATATPQQVKSQCNRDAVTVTALLLQLCRSSTLQSRSFVLLSTCAPESGDHSWGMSGCIRCIVAEAQSAAYSDGVRQNTEYCLLLFAAVQ